jgi:hypothetical protein
MALIVILTTSTVLAQGLSAPPTRVRQLGNYACPAHAEIQATWPARCPICNAVLNQVQPSAITPVSFAPLFDMDSRRRDDEARERARREEESRERFRRYGYGYGYGYYAPHGYGYPPQGYYYDPSRGYYYNPNVGSDYYPSSGYFYNRNTGQYSYGTPGNGYAPNYEYGY